MIKNVNLFYDFSIKKGSIRFTVYEQEGTNYIYYSISDYEVSQRISSFFCGANGATFKLTDDAMSKIDLKATILSGLHERYFFKDLTHLLV